jgi:hypothetical protein
MTILTQEDLKRALFYDPETGGFYYRSSHHGKKAGALAGCRDDRGYVRITLAGKSWMAHRLAFLYMAGKWPRYNVDHLNGQPSANHWDNLLDRRQSENIARARVKRKSLRGVCWKHNGWEATIKINGITEYLGRYKTQTDAAMAYYDACKRHGRCFVFDAARETLPEPPSFCAAAISQKKERAPTTIKELRDAFSYDRTTGLLTRNYPARGGLIPSGHEAGHKDKVWGYRKVKVRSKSYLAHVVIWAIVTGEWPSGIIDHINGTPDDNRWVNLRCVSASQSAINRKMPHNSFGQRGVTKSGNFYRASIQANGDRYCLGQFDTPEKASAAYQKAAAELHGEFARAA